MLPLNYKEIIMNLSSRYASFMEDVGVEEVDGLFRLNQLLIPYADIAHSNTGAIANAVFDKSTKYSDCKLDGKSFAPKICPAYHSVDEFPGQCWIELRLMHEGVWFDSVGVMFNSLGHLVLRDSFINFTAKNTTGIRVKMLEPWHREYLKSLKPDIKRALDTHLDLYEKLYDPRGCTYDVEIVPAGIAITVTDPNGLFKASALLVAKAIDV